jgi:hypothetical protein
VEPSITNLGGFGVEPNTLDLLLQNFDGISLSLFVFPASTKLHSPFFEISKLYFKLRKTIN